MTTDSQSFLERNDLPRGIVEDPFFMKRDHATDRDNAKLKTQVKWCIFFSNFNVKHMKWKCSVLSNIQ